ncbi:MAG: terpene cyclase/mutase family protein [Planctomycetota bacterium]|nr:terpene cyclase/mutase family protein [Planctomycetota bacterium]
MKLSIMWRKPIPAAAVGLVCLIVVGNVRAAQHENTSSDDGKVRMSRQCEDATKKALKWLAGKQNTDGSWSTEKYQQNTAITAFALLAFMSQGHLPGQGEYGPEVYKGSRFLVGAARDDGYLIGPRGGNMYCHGMATLALAELWGMTGDKELRPALKKAVDLIVGCQNPQGGWRYDPVPHDADISVTIMQVIALRAAKNSGISVPSKTLQRAIAYIKSLYHQPTGGFGYQRGTDSPGFARSAAGVCVLQFCGEYDAKEIDKAVAFLKSNLNDRDRPLVVMMPVGPNRPRVRVEIPINRQHFWYGHYYAAHAMHQVGGKDWEDWYARVSKLLLKKQLPDGSWNWADQENVGPEYQTAIAVIVLSIPANYVPIFEK